MSRFPPLFLRPSPTLTEEQVRRSLRLMVAEGIASGSMFSLGSGGFLAAYALALGASNFQIGLLASLPFVTQVFQVMGVALIERFRVRKAFHWSFWLIAQLMWFPIALVPFAVGTPGNLAVTLVILFLGVRGVFASIAGIAWNSWMRDLVPRPRLGSYYGLRQALITMTTAAVGLAGALFIDAWQRGATPDRDVLGFSYLLLAGALTLGLLSPVFIALSSEPQLPSMDIRERTPIFRALREPWQDNNFKQVIRFLVIWSFASNLAIPFFAVYMLTRLDMSLTSVIGLTILSQVTNVLFVRVWGPLADRFGSKTVLSLSASLYLLVIMGWPFTTLPAAHALTGPLLVALHVFAGVAAGGVTLSMGTLGLKLSPDGHATSYLAMASMATHLGTGLGPLVGGLFADFFAVRSFAINLVWITPQGGTEFPALFFTGFDFLFGIAFVLGLLSLNLLVPLREEGEVGRDVALRQLLSRGEVATRAMSSVPGLGNISAWSYGHMRRVPGLEVAVGVAAYELAAATEGAVKTSERARETANVVADRVMHTVEQAMEHWSELTEQSVEVARHAARGAIIAAGSARATPAAILGSLRAVHRRGGDLATIARSAAQGAVEGALESGVDPIIAAREAIEGVREAADEFGLDADVAEAAAVRGALDAARAAGDTIREALQESLLDQDASQ